MSKITLEQIGLSDEQIEKEVESIANSIIRDRERCQGYCQRNNLPYIEQKYVEDMASDYPEEQVHNKVTELLTKLVMERLSEKSGK